MAAAISGRAGVLVTWHLSDFLAEPLAGLGLRVTDPDQYLCELLNQLPQEVTATVVRLAGEKRRPPKTPNDLANDLAKAGVATFAGRLQATLSQTG